MVHYDGLYYALGSALTGWQPNPNKYATAKPWRPVVGIRGHRAAGNQHLRFAIHHALESSGLRRRPRVIFMGDIWKPRSQWDSRYLWMPVEIGQGKMRLPEPQEFTIDVATGEAVVKGRE